MTWGQIHPPQIEVIDYAIYAGGDPEPVIVETKMVETEQSELSDFSDTD